MNTSSAVDMLDRGRDGGTVVISSSRSIDDVMALSLVSRCVTTSEHAAEITVIALL